MDISGRYLKSSSGERLEIRIKRVEEVNYRDHIERNPINAASRNSQAQRVD